VDVGGVVATAVAGRLPVTPAVADATIELADSGELDTFALVVSTRAFFKGGVIASLSGTVDVIVVDVDGVGSMLLSDRFNAPPATTNADHAPNSVSAATAI
jgi:hypothetical protein